MKTTFPRTLDFIFNNKKVVVLAIIMVLIFVCRSRMKFSVATSSQWGNAKSLLISRYAFRGTSLPSGKILVTGGFNQETFGYTAEAEIYDPIQNTWTRTNDMNSEKGEHTATLLNNGKVLIAGGFGWPGPFSEAEIYDPYTGIFTLTGSMQQARTRHTATLLGNGKILVTGGCGIYGCNSAEIYDPITATWSYTDSMYYSRNNHIAILLNNGKVLVAGSQYGEIVGSELYNPATGNWSLTGNLNVGRLHPGAVLLNDGRVLIIGGGDTQNNQLASAEIYDPVSGIWSLVSNMHFARVFGGGQGPIKLDDGTVLVSGGDFTATSEIYYPATDTWTTPVSTNQIRYDGITAKLANGKVIIAGGFNPYDWTHKLSSTQVYPVNTTYSISGFVTDTMGNPVSDVKIISDAGEIIETNIEGAYVFNSIITGTYSITPSMEGSTFSPVSISLSIPPDASGVNFEKKISYSISGNVTDQTGYPIGNVKISTDSGVITYTLSDGSYILEDVPSGNVQIFPQLAGFIFVPNSLSINLQNERIDQDFIALTAFCDIGLSQGEDTVSGDYCNVPTAQPFLYLPVFSLSSSQTILKDTDYSGGRISSWFDHKKPLNGGDKHIELFDGIERGGIPTSTLPNGLSCYERRCYDGHDGLDLTQWDLQNGQLISEKVILPAASGIVLEVCHRDLVNYPTEACNRYPTLGRYVVISHLNNTYATLYAHLASIENWVIPGAIITRNDYSTPSPIGIMGGSGSKLGQPVDDQYWDVHLHFQVFYNGLNNNPWSPTAGEVVDTFGWFPSGFRSDDWSVPSVPLWKDFSPISCIPGAESTNITIGAISADIPSGAIPNGQVVSLTPTAFGNTQEPNLRGLGISFNLQSFSLPLSSALSTIEPSDFSQPVTVTLNYSGTLNSHLDPSQILIYWFDHVSGEWSPQLTFLDLSSNTATSFISHEGYFDLEAPLICTNDFYEPVNDYPNQKYFILSDHSETIMQDRFDIQDDVDWFSLEVNSGITFTIQTQNLAIGVDTVLTVYQSDGQTIITSDDNSGGGQASLVSLQPLENSIYYVRISQSVGSTYGCDSTYSVKISNNMGHSYLPMISGKK